MFFLSLLHWLYKPFQVGMEQRLTVGKEISYSVREGSLQRIYLWSINARAWLQGDLSLTLLKKSWTNLINKYLSVLYSMYEWHTLFNLSTFSSVFSLLFILSSILFYSMTGGLRTEWKYCLFGMVTAQRLEWVIHLSACFSTVGCAKWLPHCTWRKLTVTELAPLKSSTGPFLMCVDKDMDSKLQ